MGAQEKKKEKERGREGGRKREKEKKEKKRKEKRMQDFRLGGKAKICYRVTFPARRPWEGDV